MKSQLTATSCNVSVYHQSSKSLEEINNQLYADLKQAERQGTVKLISPRALSDDELSLLDDLQFLIAIAPKPTRVISIFRDTARIVAALIRRHRPDTINE